MDYWSFIGTLLLFTACNSDSGMPLAPPSQGIVVATDSLATSDYGQLASELLLAAPLQPASLQAAMPLADSLLGAKLAAIALGHLRSEMGSGNGPSLEGSARIRRLASDPAAPQDGNGNGRNWDEQLAVEFTQLGAFSGGPMVPFLLPSLFPWRNGSVALRGPFGVGQQPDPLSWRTLSANDTSLRLAEIGSAMRVRALAAGRLLAVGRGALAGATQADGILGLLCAEQLIDAEETLLATMFTDGGVLTVLDNPTTYDPANGARWLPTEISATLDPIDRDVVRSFRLRDGASELEGLASVLDASAELLWLCRDEQPSPATRSVFRGAPFEQQDPGKPTGPAKITFDTDVAPLLNRRCAGCHLGFATGGWQMDTLAMVLAGSPRTQQLGYPMVVPRNHAQSMLWRIVTAPPPPILRMPYFAPPMLATEAQLIADWIDQGAIESRPAPVPPLRGADLARVMFKNLVALHWDPETGSLDHRREADGLSGVATAVATGRALQALARLQTVMPGLTYQQHALADVLQSAAHFAAVNLLVDGRALASVKINDPAPQLVAGDLASEAALAAGLLSALEVLPNDPLIATAAMSTVTKLLTLYDSATSTFGGGTGYRGARYNPTLLADLLAALRLAQQFDESYAVIRQRFLAVLRPSLAHAEWSDDGEVFGDGIADADSNGVSEPALSGGVYGRLPLLRSLIVVGTAASQPSLSNDVTWTQHVRPVLLAKCGACHFQGARQGDYSLDTVTQAATSGRSAGLLAMIQPGDPERSFLYRKLVDRLPIIGQQMPLSGTLLDEPARAQIYQWISNGATRR